MNPEQILATSGLGKRFAGIQALSSLDVIVHKGQIHGLIGPNGSGKTTFFNVVSGLLPASEGKVYFDSTEITNLSPHLITKLGIGRTFQRAKLMPMMTCLENVVAGMHSRSQADLFGTYLRPPLTRSAQETRMAKRAMELLDFVGLADSAKRLSQELVWVESQLLQIARALATQPKLLLLDEPTAGMGEDETEKVDRLIRQIRDKMGITVILVAHDVNLVMGLCDWVTVLNFGQKIAEGTPAQVQSAPAVLEAYLGEE